MSFTLSEAEQALVDDLNQRVVTRGWPRVRVDISPRGRSVRVITKEFTACNKSVFLAVADVNEYLSDRLAAKLLG